MFPTDQLAALLRDFFAGNVESLELIARCSQDEIFRMIRSAIGKQSARHDLDPHLDPQEICQYVYLTLLRLRDRTARPPIQNVLAYLQRLINNAVLERRRRHVAQRRSGHRFKSIDPRDLGVVDQKSIRVQPLERREFIRAMLQELDIVERRVVTLRVHGWDWREIGVRLGGTPSSIRATYRRAIDRMRRWTAMP